MPQGCSTYGGDYVQALLDRQFFDAVYCFNADTLGAAGFALLFLGPLTIGLASYYESPTPLIVLFFLVGSVFVGQLPAGITQFAAIVLLFVMPAAAVILIKRLGK